MEMTFSNVSPGISPELSIEGMKKAIEEINKLDLDKRKSEQNALIWYGRIKHALEKYGIADTPENKLADLARYMAWKDEHKWDELLNTPIKPIAL